MELEEAVLEFFASPTPDKEAALIAFFESEDGWSGAFGLVTATDAAVRQFGCTMLLNKTKNLKANAIEESPLIDMLQQMITIVNAETDARALTIACSVLAALSMLHPNPLLFLESELFSSLPATSRLSTLRALASDSQDQDQRIREIGTVLLPSTGIYLDSASNESMVVNCALYCLADWAKAVGLGFADVVAWNLFSDILARFQQAETVMAAGELVSALCNSSFEPSAHDGTVIESLVSCVASVQSALPELDPDPRHRVIHAVKNIGKRFAALLAGGGEVSSTYYNLVLQLFVLPDCSLVEVLCEPFAALFDEGQRSEYCMGVYGQLVAVVVQRCCFSAEQDYDDFLTLRRACRDLLQSAVCVGGPDILSIIDQSLQDRSASWEGVEAFLFAVGSVIREVLPRPMGRSKEPPQIHAAINEVLINAFSQAFSSEAQAVPMLKNTAMQTAALCGTWLQNNPEHLSNILILAAHALKEEETCLVLPILWQLGHLQQVADTSIRTICIACPMQILELQEAWSVLVQVACDVCHQACSRAVYEGLTRVLVQGSADFATDQLRVLLEAAESKLRECLSSSERVHHASILNLFHTLGRTVRFLDQFPTKEESGPVPVIAGMIWPHVVETVSIYGTDEELLDAVCNCLQRIIHTGASQLSDMVSSILTFVTQVIVTSPASGTPCFDVLAAVIERFCREESLPGAVAPLLGEIVTALEPALSNVSSHPDLVSAFLDLVHRCLLHCPTAIDLCPQSNRIFEVSALCIQGEARNPLRSACLVVKHGLERSSPSMQAWIEEVSLASFATVFVQGLCVTCPIDLVGQLGQVMCIFVSQTGQVGLDALKSAFCSAWANSYQYEALLQAISAAAQTPQEEQPSHEAMKLSFQLKHAVTTKATEIANSRQ